MAAGVQVKIRKISGPWTHMLIKRRKEGYVVSVIPTHFPKRPKVTTHTPKPKVFPGMWDLAPDLEHPAGMVKLIAGQFEVLSEQFQRVDYLERWGRFKLMVEKPGGGFWKVEGYTIVCDDDISDVKQAMQALCESHVVLHVLSESREIGQSDDSHLTFM